MYFTHWPFTSSCAKHLILWAHAYFNKKSEGLLA